jgi:hypothetical protein
MLKSMKVPPNGMPALDPWLNKRNREIDGAAAANMKSLDEIFMIGITLQAKVGESEAVKASRRPYAAYALHEVGEDVLLLCSSFAGYLMVDGG